MLAPRWGGDASKVLSKSCWPGASRSRSSAEAEQTHFRHTRTEKLIFRAPLQEEGAFTGWGTGSGAQENTPLCDGQLEQDAKRRPDGVAKDGLDGGRGRTRDAAEPCECRHRGASPTTCEESVQPRAQAHERESSPTDITANEGDGNEPAVTASRKYKHDPPHRGLHSAPPVGGQEGGSTGPSCTGQLPREGPAALRMACALAVSPWTQRTGSSRLQDGRDRYQLRPCQSAEELKGCWPEGGDNAGASGHPSFCYEAGAKGQQEIPIDGVSKGK